MAHTPGSSSLTGRQVLDVLRAAHQAPSVHNSQPWLFRALPDGLEVLEDGARGLPVADPVGRDRLISCGAAIRNSQVALARLGRVPVTILLPDGPDGTLLARVVAGAKAAVSEEDEALYRAVWARHTHRRIFMARSGADDVPPAVHRAVGDGVRLAVLPPHQRGRFAQLLWEAAQHQVEDDDRLTELLEWTRRDAVPDGVPARSHGNAAFPVDGLLVRGLPRTSSPPPWVLESLAAGPVAVLLTPGDTRADQLRAGIGLESMLLAATAAGLVAAYLNQVVHLDADRERLAQMLGESGRPQVALRFGEPLVDVSPTPRRPLVDVTLGWPGT